MTVGSSNEKSAERLESLNTSITALSNNPDIQAYQLYEQNKRKIDNMAYFSNIPLFYQEIVDISGEYGIKMSQFSY
jgi:D-mannonate dehydratase